MLEKAFKSNESEDIVWKYMQYSSNNGSNKTNKGIL